MTDHFIYQINREGYGITLLKAQMPGREWSQPQWVKRRNFVRKDKNWGKSWDSYGKKTQKKQPKLLSRMIW